MVTRVSNLMLATKMLRNLQNGLANLSSTQERFSTGRMFNTPSDDPIGYMKALNIRDVLMTQKQHITNIETAISNLEYSEAILSSVNSVITRAQDVALRSSNTAMSEGTAGALAEEVSQLFEQAFSLANTIFNEGYLFSGHKVDSVPFVKETTADGTSYVVYQGDTGQRLIEVDKGIKVANNANGLETFFGTIGSIRSSVGVSDETAALSTVLTTPPPSGGDFSGTFTVNGETITVDATDTLETLRDKINDADADVVASIDSQNRLLIQSYRSIQAELEQGTSNVLQALGLVGQLEGTDIGAGIDGTTTLAALGIAVPEAIRIELDGVQTDIDLSSAVTVDDVLTTINSAGLEIDAYVNDAGTGITIAARNSGAELEVSDVRRIFGTAVGAGIDEDTTLASLGVVPDGSIEIVNGAQTVQIDLTSATTVGDVLNAINTAPGSGGVIASINSAGTGIDVRAPFADDLLEIREVGAGTTATQLGILDLQDQSTATDLGLVGESVLNETEPENLFQTLLDLEDIVRTGGTSEEIMAKHTELTSELDSLLAIRSRGGTRVNGMIELKSSFQDRELYLTELLSNNEDADLTEVIVNLQTQQLSLQAALQSGATLLQTSLLNFLS